MSSYQPLYATSSLGIDKKQGPQPLPASAFDNAVGSVSSSVVLERPNQVIIQGVGNASFKYDCTTAVGSALAAGTITNAVAVLDADTALTLDISPCAFSGSGDANVTFVYRGGL